MGITIYYSGKAKDLTAIDELITTVKEIAIAEKWKYRLVHETIQGKFEPLWGIGYGFIPSAERMQKEGIEFFPKMVSQSCNGYFRVLHTKYQTEVRMFLQEGRWPKFFVDTERKGLQLQLHPKCENLNFIFDLKTLELADYFTVSRTPGIIYGSEGFSCKTQFAGFAIHEKACMLLKVATRFLEYFEIDDESGFYDTGDRASALNEFAFLGNAIEAGVQSLNKMGFYVRRGDEL